jgi:hypothetical protein
MCIRLGSQSNTVYYTTVINANKGLRVKKIYIEYAKK